MTLKQHGFQYVSNLGMNVFTYDMRIVLVDAQTKLDLKISLPLLSSV